MLKIPFVTWIANAAAALTGSYGDITLQADLADSKIYCGSQTIRRTETLRVCFQPFEGRVWVCGPSSLRASAARRSAS